MIDTIVLSLSKDMYRITDPDRFVPSARWTLEESYSAGHGMQSKQNPTKKELHAGIYKPRLSLFPRFSNNGNRDITLKIEVSLPKLFYGNNFQELKGKDLPYLLQKLASILNQMGVIVAPEELAKAPVSAIHYSKNIALTDGSTPYHYINKIKEANIKLSLDVNQTDYRNEGHSYKWHCNSYEVVFYDKIKDLEKAKQSENRAIEKDNALQLNLFPQFVQRKKKLEILRIEVRLNKRQKMKQLFSKLGIKSDLTFKNLFKPTISKKILLHYIDELESKRLPLLDFKAGTEKDRLSILIVNNPELSSKRIMQIYGLLKAMEVMKIREIRNMLSNQNKRDWNRLMGEAKEIKLTGIQSPFSIIRTYLSTFSTLKL